MGRQVGELLLAAIPAGFDELRAEVIMFRTYSVSKKLLFRKGVKVDSLPEVEGFLEAARELRHAMATPQGGAWFQATFDVFATGRMTTTFNYDDEPMEDWPVLGPQPIMPAVFYQDWQAYPRSAVATPAWLAAKVEQGRIQAAEIEARAAAAGQTSEAVVAPGVPPEPDVPTWGPADRDELLRRVEAGLREALIPGADEARLTMTTRGGLDYSYLDEVMVHGENREATSNLDDVAELAFGLRQAMADPERGTWFEARFSVFPDGNFTTVFDYDNRPVLKNRKGYEFQLTSAAFLEDLEMYPRSPEHMPEWLAQMVAEAGSAA